MSKTDLTELEVAELEQLQAAVDAENYYALLGVGLDTNPKEIQSRYYELSRSWHPDRYFKRNLGTFEEKLQRIFIFITKAYKTLGDETKRRRYDRDHRKMLDLMRQGISTTSVSSTEAPKKKKKKRRTAEERAERAAKAARAQDKRDSGAEEAPKKAARPPPADGERRKRRRPKDARSRAIRKLRAEAKGRNNRAKLYFEQGKTDFEAGAVTKAASSLHLAVQFDPDNATFKELYEKVRLESNELLATAAMSAGESAENFRNFAEALHYYTKAAAFDPKGGEVFFRLALLVKQVEADNRKALDHLRKAAKKSPRNIGFRLELGDLYAEMSMGLNARREYQAVLSLDKGNQRAKSGLKGVR